MSMWKILQCMEMFFYFAGIFLLFTINEESDIHSQISHLIPRNTVSHLSFLLPTRASEQGNVIGLVSIYTCHKKNCN